MATVQNILLTRDYESALENLDAWYWDELAYPDEDTARDAFEALVALYNNGPISEENRRQVRLVKRLLPCANPQERLCQHETENWVCFNQAIVDAPSKLGGQWGYWCEEHWTFRPLSLVHIITSEPYDIILEQS